MVVDSSAIFAIAFNELERPRFINLILESGRCVIGAPTLLECRIVALRRAGGDWNTVLHSVIEQFGLTVVPFDEEHLRLATDAFRQFGKGRNAASLNFGDCMAYAIAKARNEPLLFKGGDFRLTDIMAAD
jgi:ribonuclease VapC